MRFNKTNHNHIGAKQFPIGIGILLVYCATILELWASGKSFSFANAIQIHLMRPSFWLVDISLVIHSYFLLRKNPTEQPDLDGIAKPTEEITNDLKLIFEHSPTPMVVLNREKSIVMVNPAFEELFGYTNADVIGGDLDKLISDPSTREEAERSTEMVRKGYTIHQKAVRRRKDGRNVEVEIRGVPIVMNGIQTAMMAIYRDLSTEKEIEDTLNQNIVYYQSLFENSPISLWELDFSNVLPLVNYLPIQSEDQLAEFFAENPDFVNFCVSKIKVINVNRSAVELVGATTKKEFLEVWPSVRSVLSILFSQSSFLYSESPKVYEYDIELKSVRGNLVIGRLKAVVPPGHEGDLSRVYMSVENLTGHKLTESYLIDALTELEDIAKLDPLTQLPNRRELLKVLYMQREDAIEGQKGLGLALLDLDYLKTINDNYGHTSGDLALTRMAEILRNSCRGDDFVGRWGGDEFVMIAQVDSNHVLQQIISRLHQNLGSTTITIEDKGQIQLSVSIGAAFSSSSDLLTSSLEDLIDEADQALYFAKESGRNRVKYNWQLPEQRTRINFHSMKG